MQTRDYIEIDAMAGIYALASRPFAWLFCRPFSMDAPSATPFAPSATNSSASGATAFHPGVAEPSHPGGQRQQQQPLEAAPEGVAAWLRHIAATAFEQVPH